MRPLRERLEQQLQRSWYERTPGSAMLRPLGWLYQGLARRRRTRLTARQVQLPVPVVIVGNISVGGTGKSPLTAALVKLLRAEDYRPAILMRGYGNSEGSFPHLVEAVDPVEVVGDEALMLKQMLDCPVMVDPDRVRGARALIQSENPDIILCDDGLQHYALWRDLEMVVLDGERGLGNALPLPAGPLREGIERLDEVDMVLCNGTAEHLEESLRSRIHYEFHLQPGGWRNLVSGECYPVGERPFAERVQAIAGIGNPQRFFNALKRLGLELTEYPMPDHFQYHPDDMPGDDAPLVMTAKDGVKCGAFARPNWWVLDVEAELPENLRQDFLQRCELLISRSAE